MKEERGAEPRFGLVNFERRSHPRFSVNLPIEYSYIDSFKTHLGCTANVSENGLLIYVPEQIEIGKHLRLKIFFSVGLGVNFIEAIVEVVWKDTDLGKDGDYRTGAKYVDISPEGMDKLKSFLNNLMDSKAPQKSP
jgi:hypothetical protein